MSDRMHHRFPVLPAVDHPAHRLALAFAGLLFIPCVLVFLAISCLAIRAWKAIKEVTVGISDNTKRQASARLEIE